MITDREKLQTVLVTDCGSTTTKALLFEKKSEGWRQTYRGEAPTTVEAPVADVTVGAINAFSEVQELSGRKILKDQARDDESPFVESGGEAVSGVDLYLSTSSAGGGAADACRRRGQANDGRIGRESRPRRRRHSFGHALRR